MKYRLFRWSAVCLLVLLGTSCDQATPTDPAAYPRLADVVPGNDGKQYTLLEGQLVTGKQETSAWIDRDGGLVWLEGEPKDGERTFHAVYVPERAVNKPTLFTIRLVPGKHIKVDLRAHLRERDGSLRDVGKAGFKQPVYLIMSYAWATNLTDPQRATILYDPEDGKPHQKLPAVPVLEHHFVYAPLYHFSLYAMAQD